ncbi:MAG: 30S ribosomal protein S1 [Bdellovibrionales bacterium]|nr:30S ribosomal protein S1 [Bdellovibrionales bacterium]
MDKDIKKTKTQIQKEKVLSLLNEADKIYLKSPALDPVTTANGNESFGKLYEESLKRYDFKIGDVVKGRVISIEDDYVLVDINYKSEGFIPKSEFRMVAGQNNIQVGQELDVYIDRIENENGMMVLSKDRADIIRIWKDISKVVENEEVIEGTVIAKVKGGLSVDIGVKAFLPGSQIELRPVKDLNSYVGRKLQFKVIKFNQKRGNIVLSRRVLLSQERKNLRSRTLSEIKEGAVIKGVVKNITDYGVFLDLGGLDGLLHITDMSWNRIKYPSELVSLGDEIEVKVLKFDQEKNRVSLGLKQLKEDPWGIVSSEIKIGDVLKAHVVSLMDYGAFMRLREGVEGLVHVSEMSWGKKTKHPSQLLKVDEEVDVKVLGVDQENHRISLGIKQLTQNPWMELKEQCPAGTQMEVTVRSVTDFGLFVEIKDKEMEGFIHVSDLSWMKHISPKEQYKKGDVLLTVVKDVSLEEERFNLSVKHLEEDPWLNVESKYPPGSRHEVKVKKLMDFGVFVELEPGIEGLIHISELSVQRVETTSQAVQLGDILRVEVLNIDLEARKIGLSVKQVQLREEQKSDVSVNVEKKSNNEEQPVPPKKKKEESFFGRALKASLGVASSGSAEATKADSSSDPE